MRLVLTDGQCRDPHTGDPLDQVAAASLLIAGTGVLDYGRTARIVPARLRRALAVRDRGFAFAGCHRPPTHPGPTTSSIGSTTATPPWPTSSIPTTPWV